jgi:ribosomal protein L16 Arg81 hydroxylase
LHWRADSYHRPVKKKLKCKLMFFSAGSIPATTCELLTNFLDTVFHRHTVKKGVSSVFKISTDDTCFEVLKKRVFHLSKHTRKYICKNENDEKLFR